MINRKATSPSLFGYLLSFIVWTVVPLFAYQAFADGLEEYFTYGQLKQFISSNSIQTIDQLLPYLPTSTRQNFALVFKTRSIQPASLASPRVLLFRADGGLGLGFSTINPGALEVLEFNSVTGKMEPRMVKFEGGVEFIDDPLQHFANTPMRCTRCHSERLHYIWDAYPRWPGVFGHTDKIDAKSAPLENLAFEALKISIDQTNLLRHLPGIATSSIADLGNQNTRITNLLGETNAKRIIFLLTESSKFLQYRAALFAALIGDPKFKFYLSAADQAEFNQRYPQLKETVTRYQSDYSMKLNVRQDQNGESAGGYELFDESAAKMFEAPVAAKVMFIAEKMGVPMQDWWMSLEQWTFAAATGNRGLWRDLIPPYVEFLRSTDGAAISERELIPFLGTFKLKEWYPVAQVIQKNIWSQEGSRQSFPRWYSPAGLKHTCQQLLSGGFE